MNTVLVGAITIDARRRLELEQPAVTDRLDDSPPCRTSSRGRGST
jgi:hypothetical protein